MDSSSWIQTSLVVVLLVAVLRRSEPKVMGWNSARTSANKARSAFLQVWILPALFSPPAGRGGEGWWRRAGGSALVSVGGDVLLSQAGRGGEERRHCDTCYPAPAWKLAHGTGYCEKHRSFLPPLDCRGGEGRRRWEWMLTAGPRRQNSKKLDLRQIPSDGYESRCYPWPRGPLRASRARALRIVLLQAVLPIWRSIDPSTATHPDGGPSGVVPGAAASGRALRSSQRRGGEEGPDCSPVFSARVFLVKLEGLFALLVFVRVLFVRIPTE